MKNGAALALVVLAACKSSGAGDGTPAPTGKPVVVADADPRGSNATPATPMQFMEIIPNGRHRRALDSYRSCTSDERYAGAYRAECAAIQQQIGGTPVISVTETEVAFQGQPVARIDQVIADASVIATLQTSLEASEARVKKALAAGQYPKDVVDTCNDPKPRIGKLPDGTFGALPEQICPHGLAIIRAGKLADIRVINAIVATAKAAGFDSLLLDVTKD